MKRLIIVPLTALLLLMGATAFFYQGRYLPPATPPPALEQLVPPAFVTRALPVAVSPGAGSLLLDQVHRNRFEPEELNALLSRVTARGYTVERVNWTTPLENILDAEEQLEYGLRFADSLLVVLPRWEFSFRERELIREFVSKGGRLLLIGDATRAHRLNSLSADFDIRFENDYLYNTKEHDINYQYIFLRDFFPHPLTAGLTEVVFYAASSISSGGEGLIFSDANTVSSLRTGQGRFATAVVAAEGRVLAISDLTFLSHPYNLRLDNSRLISNIADFLTTSQRSFYLTDFPHFFRGEVDLIVGRQELLKEAESLLSLLLAPQREVEVKREEDPWRETVFVGLWPDAARVRHYLTSGGIEIGQRLRTPVIKDVAREGVSLLFLYENQGRHILILLADTRAEVRETVALLKSGGFRQGIVSQSLGLYRLGAPAGERAVSE